MFYLGSNHGATIWLRFILIEVILVVFLCRIELPGGDNFSDNRLVPDSRCYFHLRFFSFLLLLVGIVKNSRAVLGTYIASLSVESGRIMTVEKYSE